MDLNPADLTVKCKQSFCWLYSLIANYYFFNSNIQFQEKLVKGW